jgi:class 3 adenylate cyclase/CHASE2 domain-containing sensor protein
VGLDVIFDQLRRDHPKILEGDKLIESDTYFRNRLSEAGNVILGSGEVAPHPVFRIAAAGLGDISTLRDSDGVLRRALPFRDYRLWHPEILLMADINHWDLKLSQIHTNEIWFQNPDGTYKPLPITEDRLYNTSNLLGEKPAGIVRLKQAFEDVRVWHLGLTLAAVELGIDLNKAKVEKNRIVLTAANGLQRIIPLDAKGRFLIDWAVPLKHPELRRRPFEVVIQSHVNRERGSNNIAPVFRDKLVIVGSTATGNDLTDLGATPLDKETILTSNNWNVINSLLTGRFVRETGPFITHLLICGLGLLGGLVTWKFRPLWASASVITCGLVYVFFAGVWFTKSRVSWPIIMPVTSLIFTHAALLSYQVFFEQGERRRIRQIFSKVVSPKVVNELLNSEKLALGGKRVEATVFFADVRGFTEVTDNAQAQAEEYVRSHGLVGTEAEAYFDSQSAEVLQTVNAYLGAIADVIRQHDGTLDKYIGDCVMAFWGAPTSNPRHAVAAVQAGIQAQRAIQALNEQRALENQVRKIENAIRIRRNEPPLTLLKLLTLGTGINSGLMTAGLMGSSHHEANFTVFGREVNLAARLEATSGQSRILIGEGTYRALLKDAPDLASTCVELPSVTVKGFRQPVKVFEVPWKNAPATHAGPQLAMANAGM